MTCCDQPMRDMGIWPLGPLPKSEAERMVITTPTCRVFHCMSCGRYHKVPEEMECEVTIEAA